tara:strand:+ start:484 stop:1383 length:900 start_codon:yes stop_codon:yes gene_type:complete
MGTNIMTSLRHDPDIKNIRDLERMTASFAGPYLIADMLLGARYRFRMSEILDAGRIGDDLPEVDNSTQIVGTNDEMLYQMIESFLQSIGVRFRVERDYEFFNKGIEVYHTDDVDEEPTYEEVSLKVKYMFMLTSLEWDEPTFKSTSYSDDHMFDGSYAKLGAILLYRKEEDFLIGPPVYHPFCEEEGLDLHQNSNYETHQINDDVDVIPSRKAAECVLDMAALTVDDGMLDAYREKTDEEYAKLDSSETFKWEQMVEKRRVARRKGKPVESVTESSGSGGLWKAVLAVIVIGVVLTMAF